MTNGSAVCEVIGFLIAFVDHRLFAKRQLTIPFLRDDFDALLLAHESASGTKRAIRSKRSL